MEEEAASIIDACIIGEVATDDDVRMEVATDITSRSGGAACWEWGRPPVRKRSLNILLRRKNLRMEDMKQDTHRERERERHKECLYS